MDLGRNKRPLDSFSSAAFSGHESRDQLISLTDYAAKYRVSITTLRRRLKAGQLRHQLINGKYYLLDRAPIDDFGAFEKLRSNGSTAQNAIEPSFGGHPVPVSTVANEELVAATAKILNEMKQSYSLILREKEEQILHLKEEIADLKTLVKVLEAQNS